MAGGDKPNDVDETFVALFIVMDENDSWLLSDNIKRYAPDLVDKMEPNFLKSNKMHAINGYVYGNTPGLNVCIGDRVSWHLFSFGNDIHTGKMFAPGQRTGIYVNLC